MNSSQTLYEKYYKHSCKSLLKTYFLNHELIKNKVNAESTYAEQHEKCLAEVSQHSNRGKSLLSGCDSVGHSLPIIGYAPSCLYW